MSSAVIRRVWRDGSCGRGERDGAREVGGPEFRRSSREINWGQKRRLLTRERTPSSFSFALDTLGSKKAERRADKGDGEQSEGRRWPRVRATTGTAGEKGERRSAGR